MNENKSLSEVFQMMLESTNPPTIELLDLNQTPVGVLYMSSMRVDTVTISETNTLEKYFLVINGVGIYFTYYKIIKN